MEALPHIYTRIDPGSKELYLGDELHQELAKYLNGAEPDIENKNLIKDINVLYIISNNKRFKDQFSDLIQALNESLESRTQYTLLNVVQFLNKNKGMVKSAGIELEKEARIYFYYLLTSAFIVSLAGTVLALHVFQNQLLTMLTLGAMVANPATPLILGAVLLVAAIWSCYIWISYRKLKKQHFKYVDPAPTPDIEETSDDLEKQINDANESLKFEYNIDSKLFELLEDSTRPIRVLKIEGSEAEKEFLEQMNIRISYDLFERKISIDKQINTDIRTIYHLLMGERPDITNDNRESELLKTFYTYQFQAFDAYKYLLGNNISESLANDDGYQSTLEEFKTIYPVFFEEQESSSSNSQPLFVSDEEQESSSYFGDKAVSSRAEARAARLHQTIIKARLTRLNLLKLILPTVDLEKISQAAIKTMLDKKLEQMATMIKPEEKSSTPDMMLRISQIVLKERENLVKVIAENALASTKTPDEETLSSIEDELKETRYAELLGQDVNENLLNVSKTYFQAKFDDRASFYADEIFEVLVLDDPSWEHYVYLSKVGAMDSALRKLTFKHLDEKLKEYVGTEKPDVLKHRINALKDHINGKPRDINAQEKKHEDYNDMRDTLSELKAQYESKQPKGSGLFSGNPFKVNHGLSKGPQKNDE